MISKDKVDDIFELTGVLVDSEKRAVEILQSHLSDLDCNEYDDIDDVDLLLDIVQIFESNTTTFSINPFERAGGVILTDEWLSIQKFTDLKNFLERDHKWQILYRRHYYVFKVNGRIFFRLEALRRTVSEGGYSCRLILYRIPDLNSLKIELSRYNLLQFEDRDWKIVIDKKLNTEEAHGKYFLLSEVEDIAIEISKRL